MLIDSKYITKAKEKLGTKMAFIIAEELGIEDFDERNMKCCCPFHQEDTPSLEREIIKLSLLWCMWQKLRYS